MMLFQTHLDFTDWDVVGQDGQICTLIQTGDKLLRFIGPLAAIMPRTTTDRQRKYTT